jgi:Family of unknown function (DUF6325)
MTGPVQVLVVGFEHPRFSGEVVAELVRLREAGIVRLVDLLLVRRDGDGALEVLELPDGAPQGLGEIAAALLGRDASETDEPDEAEPEPSPDEVASWSLGDAVPPGATVAVALIEHLWAGPLREAVGRAGGTTLDETWLSAADLAVLAELERRTGTNPA